MKYSPKLLFKKIMAKNKLCVLATSSLNGKPEAATIEFAEDAKSNIYFETFQTYRKYKNLQANGNASIVITDVPHTIQMDGIVTELKGTQASTAVKLLIRKHGFSKRYTDPEVKLFMFTPKWIRLLASHRWPPQYVTIKGGLKG